MRLRHLAPIAAAAIALASYGTAHALTVIDFEGDTSGAKADGLQSTGFPQLSLFTDLGAGLELATIPEGDGRSLLVRNDSNGNFLVGLFNDGLHNFLSMTFGNDDPGFSNPGDRATLTVYNRATLVGATFVVFNRNDLMDQTIGFSFGAFDNWTLAYANAAGAPFTGGGGVTNGLIEVVDNITFDDPDPRVTPNGDAPEPATWGMMILGFGGVGAIMRRRRPAFA